MEFRLSEVINSLINNRPSPAMSSYCLLLKKLLRYQKDHKRAEVRNYGPKRHKVLPGFLWGTMQQLCSTHEKDGYPRNGGKLVKKWLWNCRPNCSLKKPTFWHSQRWLIYEISFFIPRDKYTFFMTNEFLQWAAGCNGIENYFILHIRLLFHWEKEH